MIFFSWFLKALSLHWWRKKKKETFLVSNFMKIWIDWAIKCQAPTLWEEDSMISPSRLHMDANCRPTDMNKEEHIWMEHRKRRQSVTASTNEKSTNSKVARLQLEPLQQGWSSQEVKSEAQWQKEGRNRFKNAGRIWACLCDDKPVEEEMEEMFRKSP